MMRLLMCAAGTCCIFVLLGMFCKESNGVFINSSNGLEEYIMSGLTDCDIQLNSSIVHYISSVLFIAKMNVIVTSDSDSSAVIRCDNSGGGLAFLQCSVIVKYVSFINCGLSLMSLPSPAFEILEADWFPFKYRFDYSAVLVCTHCIALELSNVSFTSSIGFSVVALDCLSTNLQFITVSNVGTVPNRITGSGVLLYYASNSTQSKEVRVNEAIFHDIRLNNKSVSFSECPKRGPRHLIPFACGLTIVYTNNCRVNTNVSNSRFFRNSATSLLLFYNNTHTAYSVIHNLVFSDNSCPNDNKLCSKFSASLKSCWEHDTVGVASSVVFSNIMFEHHLRLQPFCINSRMIGVNLIIFLGNISFHDNLLFAQGSACMDIRSSRQSELNLHIVNITAVGNNHQGFGHFSGLSVIKFSYVDKIEFFGYNSFKNNRGSAIDIVESNLHLNDRLSCVGNTAYEGACIKVNGLPPAIYLNRYFRGYFENNSVISSGGAIFANPSSSQSSLSCAFQIDSSGNEQPLLTFSGNKALVAGTAVYAEPIFNCTLFTGDHTSMTTGLEIKQYLAIDQSDTVLQNISTAASYLRIEISGKRIDPNSLLMLHPGDIVSLHLNSFDALNRYVHSDVHVGVTNFTGDTRVWFDGFKERSFYHVEIPEDEEGLRFETSVHSVTTQFNASVVFVLLPKNPSVVFHIVVAFKDCPFKYVLDREQGSCTCSSFIDRFEKYVDEQIICENSTLAIIVPPSIGGSWIGVTNNNETLVQLSRSCHFAHCFSDLQFRQFVINESLTVVTNYNRTEYFSVCRGGRTGVLCGRCEGEKGLVFGSTECMKCSNLWLLLTPLFLLAGLLMIVALYAGNVTLTTGRFNGVIFFAQLAYAGIMDVLTYSILYSESTSLVLALKLGKGVISAMNLAFGFPVCFYSKMTQVQKTGLTLLYPGYMLLLVVFVALISKRCVWLSTRIASSSVQVIVTIIHLSFSKLLLLIIDVFTSAAVYTEGREKNDIVWYFDGSEEYMKGSHLVLALVSVFLAGPLILAYLFFLLFTKTLLKRSAFANKYLRPFYEAIHAPYKPSMECFFTLRLILLIIIYFVYAGYRSTNPLAIFAWTIPLLTTYLVLQIHFKPFKSNVVTFIESFVLLSETIAYTICYYYMRPDIESLGNAATVCVIEVFLIFTIFLMIFVFNALRDKHRLFVTNFFQQISKYFFQKETNDENYSIVSNITNDSYYRSCTHFREPILSIEQN